MEVETSRRGIVGRSRCLYTIKATQKPTTGTTWYVSEGSSQAVLKTGQQANKQTNKQAGGRTWNAVPEVEITKQEL